MGSHFNLLPSYFFSCGVLVNGRIEKMWISFPCCLWGTVGANFMTHLFSLEMFKSIFTPKKTNKTQLILSHLPYKAHYYLLKYKLLPTPLRLYCLPIHQTINRAFSVNITFLLHLSSSQLQNDSLKVKAEKCGFWLRLR